MANSNESDPLLRTLYEISLLLASFTNIEQAFPAIITKIAGTVPFHSAILIEKRRLVPQAAIWHTSDAGKGKIDSALKLAKDSYAYLTGASTIETDRLEVFYRATLNLQTGSHPKRSPPSRTNFIVCPLVVRGPPAFGIFQWESSKPLKVVDVAFLNTIANLIAVALDRYYTAQDELSSREQVRVLRERFISGLGHDLRTPLTAAKMSAELILRQPDKTDKIGALAHRIVSYLGRVDQMIQEFLNANRSSTSGPPALEVENSDLCAITREAIADMVTLHGDRFVLQAQDSEMRGFWNHAMIRRVIENLLLNAVKYGAQDIPITVALTQTRQEVRFSIQNGGNPISAQNQARLFQPSFRTDDAQDSTVAGWGLGLMFVNNAVIQHRGSIQLKSGPGIGTTFTITLPKNAQFTSKAA